MDNGPRVGVGIIITRGDEVLLVRRTGTHGADTWSTPGGHLDSSEQLEQCAAREAMEETGVDVGDIRFRAVTNDVFPGGRHYVTIWMEGEYLGGEPTARALDEVSSVGWFRWKDLPRPLFLPLANLLAGRCYPAVQRDG